AFDINVVSFVLVIVALVICKPTEAPRQKDHLPWRIALTEGFRIVRRHPGKFRLIWTTCGFVFFTAPIFALLTAYSERRLGGERYYYYLLSSIGAGAVFGSFLVGRLIRALGRQQTMALAGLVLGSVLGSFAFNSSLVVAVALSFAFGVGWSVLFTTQNTALQMLTPDAVRARVMSVNVLSWVAAPIGQAFFGWLATPTLVDVTGALQALGAGTLVIAVFQTFSVVPQIEGSALPEPEAVLVKT
ncbi:MAG TPA: MFS transporter, partial [Planctomycetota bacterium]|nr:MFS transporter [Planctomycetota bacterium]